MWTIDPALTLRRVDFAYRFKNEKFWKKEKILMNSNLVHLAVIGDLLKSDACKLHMQLILLSRQRFRYYITEPH